MACAACVGGAASSGRYPTDASPSNGTPAVRSTAGVLCGYSTRKFNNSPAINATSTSAWRCDGTSRVLSANGLPDHETGSFPNPNSPFKISAQPVAATIPLTPAVIHPSGARSRIAGFALNGIKLDPGTAGTCDDTGTVCNQGRGGGGAWRMEAMGQSSFNFGTDASNAHVQPEGAYHYHGIPEGLVAKLAKGRAMTLIGWAVDGFPIYARYGHIKADDPNSPIKVLGASYRHKAEPDPGRPPTRMYPMGAFAQDWQYQAGSGDLDECNGRTGVTPEFPGGIYHYVATDTYPFVHRCVKGAAPAGPGRGPPPRP
jgi:YHYH protein